MAKKNKKVDDVFEQEIEQEVGLPQPQETLVKKPDAPKNKSKGKLVSLNKDGIAKSFILKPRPAPRSNNTKTSAINFAKMVKSGKIQLRTINR